MKEIIEKINALCDAIKEDIVKVDLWNYWGLIQTK